MGAAASNLRYSSPIQKSGRVRIEKMKKYKVLFRQLFYFSGNKSYIKVIIELLFYCLLEITFFLKKLIWYRNVKVGAYKIWSVSAISRCSFNWKRKDYERANKITLVWYVFNFLNYCLGYRTFDSKIRNSLWKNGFGGD